MNITQTDIWEIFPKKWKIWKIFEQHQNNQPEPQSLAQRKNTDGITSAET